MPEGVSQRIFDINIRGASQSMFLSSPLLPSFRHCCSHDVHASNREQVERHSAESGVRRWRRPFLRRVRGHREETRPGLLLWAREGVWEQTSRSGNWWLLLKKIGEKIIISHTNVSAVSWFNPINDWCSCKATAKGFYLTWFKGERH